MVVGVSLLPITLLAEGLDAPRTKTNAPKDTAVVAKAEKTPNPAPVVPPAPKPSYEPGQVRIKDIAEVQGVRGNQLFGYGLVLGLEGTGDGQQSIFTVQSVINMLRRLGINPNVTPQQMQVKNVAAVMVTAELPAFSKEGSKIDVTVSSIGDAKSLQGGTLLQTPLLAANNQIYAVAQGAISIGGLNISAGGASVQKNFVNVGRIPKGAIVEQEVPTTITDGSSLQLTLREPDFTTASRVAEELKKRRYSAQALDAATIKVIVPPEFTGEFIRFLAEIEGTYVTPDVQARVVINERTGTVVVGGNVRLAPGTVAHGSISIRIESTPVVLPPVPFNPNPGQVVPMNSVEVKEQKAKFAPVPSTQTIEQMVSVLSRLGLTPRDLIIVLQGMHRAGMINAQIEVQ
jgi:flagellar P-ring protein precursor FlgI